MVEAEYSRRRGEKGFLENVIFDLSFEAEFYFNETYLLQT